MKEIILGNHKIKKISVDFAFELLRHMKGGPSIEVLLDLALEKDSIHTNQALDVLKTQVFLYEADMERIEKAEKGDTVMSTSTRLFKGRVVKDSERKKGESLLSSTPVVILSSILGRIPTIDEYKVAIKGIKITKFKPTTNDMTSKLNHLISY